MTDLDHTATDPKAPNLLIHAQANLSSGLYRIRIPAGTRRWAVSVNTYKAPEEAHAWLRMDQAPARAGAPLQDTRRTLEGLWHGEELHAFSPENSGALTISTPESTDPFVTEKERWLYLDLVFPAGKALSWYSRIELAEGRVVSAPVPTPAAPSHLEGRTLDLAQRSGLVPALARLSGAKSEVELVTKARDSGAWAALVEMVRLSEEGTRRAR